MWYNWYSVDSLDKEMSTIASAIKWIRESGDTIAERNVQDLFNTIKDERKKKVRLILNK